MLTVDCKFLGTTSFTRVSNVRYSVHLHSVFKMRRHDLYAHTQVIVTTYYIVKTLY